MTQARMAAALAGAGLVVAACLFETSPRKDRDAGRHLRYQLRIGDPAAPRCSVTVRIERWPDGGPMLFQAPPYYADNPLLPFTRRFSAADFRGEDARGNPVAAKDVQPVDTRLGGSFISFPPGTRLIRYAVDQAPADSARFGLPLPGLRPGVQAVDGAYYFLLPVVSHSMPEQWRLPITLDLDIEAAPGFAVLGQAASARLKTNYELMFVRAMVNPARAHSFPVRGRTVTTYVTTFDTVDLDVFDTLLARCINLVEDSLMPLPPGPLAAGEAPVFYGIEGTQGYWYRHEAQDEANVQVHELIHFLVGVHHGDLEDPWWKEGITNYLGELLTLQAGLHPESLFQATVLNPRDSLPSVRDYALANPAVRGRLFLPLDSLYLHPKDPEDFVGLVYGKGSSAAMILDRRLLEGSGGRHSLFSLVRLLVSRHGAAFRREDLVSAVTELSGSDSRAFLDQLLDKPGPISSDSLRSTYSALKSRGRFLPAIPAGPLARGPLAKRGPESFPSRPSKKL